MCTFYTIFPYYSVPQPAATITFSSNWEEKLEGSLVPGEAVRIIYHADRLPRRDTRYGQRAWYIFAEVKYSQHGAVQSVMLEGPGTDGMMTTTLNIPSEAKIFEIWFKHSGYYSGSSYDSNYGDNYNFLFTQVVFSGDWSEHVNGELHPGEKFQVVYNATRLPWRDLGYLNTGRAWDIYAHAQFSDQGPVVQQMLAGPEQDGETMTTVYDIPKDADTVVMWFQFRGVRTGKKYDSNHSKNYHFDLTKY